MGYQRNLSAAFGAATGLLISSTALAQQTCMSVREAAEEHGKMSVIFQGVESKGNLLTIRGDEDGKWSLYLENPAPKGVRVVCIIAEGTDFDTPAEVFNAKTRVNANRGDGKSNKKLSATVEPASATPILEDGACVSAERWKAHLGKSKVEPLWLGLLPDSIGGFMLMPYGDKFQVVTVELGLHSPFQHLHDETLPSDKICYGFGGKTIHLAPPGLGV